MQNSLVCPGSLNPPSHGDAALLHAQTPKWSLLDFRAYFADRRNATTATCKISGNREIQVTFFPAPPPLVSYFCVHCPGVEPSSFVSEPKIIAMDADLVLLRVSIGHHYAMGCPSLSEYCVYRAGGTSGGPPLLELLPHPSPYLFYHDQVGLLSRGTGYTIAALRDDSSGIFRDSCEPGHYDVCLFHSEDRVWTATDVFVPPEQLEHSNCEGGFWFNTCKVLTIGGEYGTMAFVDLWHGVLLYDVFRPDPMLRYIALPQQLHPGRKPNGSPWITRDITIVKDQVKLVQVLMKTWPGKASHRSCSSDGWVATTWSRMANFPQDDSWPQNFKIDAYDNKGKHDRVLSELLRRLPDDEGKPRLSLGRLFIGQPTISLDEDDIVYFMTQVPNQLEKAWVIAVDMRRRTLQGVAEYSTERTCGISLTYTQSRISEHLNMAPGMEGSLKRQGMPLPRSGGKKLFGVANVDAEPADDINTC